MALIWFLLMGLVAGAIAKMITPQQEKGGWISSMAIGIIGAAVGKFIANLLPLTAWLDSSLIGEIAVAIGGSVLVLWIYHKYLADKLNLPI